jgi:hypothetical protein
MKRSSDLSVQPLRHGWERVTVAGLFRLAAACAGLAMLGACSKSAQSPSSSKHYFEGSLEWRGVEGKPPGTPWSMTCSMHAEDLLCDVSSATSPVLQIGFRGPGSTLCFRIRGGPIWIPLSLQTAGMFISLVPEPLRQDAVHKTQAQYRFTGQKGSFLGRSCETVEIREDDGDIENVCYSGEEYFEGDQKLVPVLQQIGFEPTFIANLARYGIGWHAYETTASGEPKLLAEIARVEPGTIPTATFAGVCGLP